MENSMVFSGSSHPELAAEICRYLDVPLRPSTTRRFSNDNLEVQLGESVREHDVYIVQTFSRPVQEHSSRAHASEISPAASASPTAGCSPSRRDQPSAPPAAPRVTRVCQTSHGLGPP